MQTRDFADLLVGRSVYLPAAERVLVQAVYVHGRSLTEIATLLGDTPRNVGRRVRDIAERAMDPTFAFVAACRDHGAWAAWGRTKRAVAIEYVLKGRSLRAVARDLKISFYQARRFRDALVAMASVQPRQRVKVPALRVGEAA